LNSTMREKGGQEGKRGGGPVSLRPSSPCTYPSGLRQVTARVEPKVRSVCID
jgi:hypothetical protein